MNKKKYLTCLGEALCGKGTDLLVGKLAENCNYVSDYAKVQVKTADKILKRMKSVDDTLLKNGEINSYRYETTSLKDIVREDVDLDDINDCHKFKLYNQVLLYYRGEAPEPVAIVLAWFNESGKISDIYLSRNRHWFNTEFSGDELDSKNDKPYTVILEDEHDEELRERSERYCRKYENLSDDEVYIWRQANRNFRKILDQKFFYIFETKIFDDCIAYKCKCKDSLYTIYLIARGENNTRPFDIDFYHSLVDREYSEGIVLVSYVRIKRDFEGEKAIYRIGKHNDIDDPVELWQPAIVKGKKRLVFFTRDDVNETMEKLAYAYTNMDIDVLSSIVPRSNPSISDDKGTSLNDGFYYNLQALHKEYPVMKIGYMTFNDEVYCYCPYIENYKWISFSYNDDSTINGLQLRSFDEEKVTFCMDVINVKYDISNIPRIVKVVPLEANNGAGRFTLKAYFDNGEVKKYALPIEAKDNNDEAIKYDRHVFSDGIWQSAKINENPSTKFKGFRRYLPTVEFKNSYQISSYLIYTQGFETFRKVRVSEENCFVRQHEGNYGVGNVNDDGHLYFVDLEKHEGYQLPDIYKDTPIYLSPYCGGYSEGLIMVSLIGEIRLQYHHDQDGAAGMWGWIDTNGNVVIEPQYVFALNMYHGKAVVCKGEWSINKDGRYWCENEQWGIIDNKGKEVIPFIFNEITEIENTESFYLCHEGDWKNDSHYSVWNVDTRTKEFDLDFNFDNVYMFNECYQSEDNIIFFEHDVDESKNYLYVYSLTKKKWLAHKELISETERKTVTTADGLEVTLY